MCHHGARTVIYKTDFYLISPSTHLYGPWFCVLCLNLLLSSVSLWAVHTSGNTVFINNSFFCQRLSLFFFLFPFLLKWVTLFPFQFFWLFSHLPCALPFQLPRYFAIFSVLTASTELPPCCAIHRAKRKWKSSFCSLWGCWGAPLHSKINANESLIPYSLGDWCKHWCVHYMNLYKTARHILIKVNLKVYTELCEALHKRHQGFVAWS